jgi:hypothetical protein
MHVRSKGIGYGRNRARPLSDCRVYPSGLVREMIEGKRGDKYGHIGGRYLTATYESPILPLLNMVCSCLRLFIESGASKASNYGQSNLIVYSTPSSSVRGHVNCQDSLQSSTMC